MRCISSISLLVVFSLAFAGGCQQSVEVIEEEPVVVDTPDNESMPEQIEQELVDTAKSAPRPDQLQTEEPVEVETPRVEVVTDIDTPGEAEQNQPETAKEIKGPMVRFEKVVHDYGDLDKILDELVKQKTTHKSLRTVLDHMASKGSVLAGKYAECLDGA